MTETTPMTNTTNFSEFLGNLVGAILVGTIEDNTKN